MDFKLIWLVLGLPVLGFLIQAFFGGRVISRMGAASGRKVMGWLAVLPIAGAFGAAVGITMELAKRAAEDRAVVETLFSWIRIASINVPFEVRIDPLSMTMVLIITGIGALIHLYATGYMAEEKDYSRFFTYMNLFVAFMLVLVLGNNLVLLFIGWEGVGLCSYLLIGFWYKDLANSRAANKAFIVNRIGDWGMTLGMFMIVAMIAGNLGQFQGVEGRYLSYDVVFSSTAIEIFRSNPGITTAIALLLFVGAMGKSAQFPLYIWLPDAMAGPTPVSALIHAATMVTSGVVLLNRCNVIFQLSPVASSVVCVIGAFTALFAALIAFGQTDIKKVLAYSTVSQLGYMFIACGAGAYWAGLFHVTTHAFFKALLFLGSGAVIHAMAHNQDMRNYGNLLKYLKITGWTMVIGWLAISGVAVWTFFGFAGFYSKESILGAAFGNNFASINGVNYGFYSAAVGLLVALLTSLYMTRMTMLTFFGNEERWKLIPAHSHAEHSDHAHHASHAHEHEHDHHGPDVESFFFNEEELALAHAHEDHEHHHELDENHVPHEVPTSMWMPLVILAALSVLGGFVLAQNNVFEYWLYPKGELTILGELEHHPHWHELLVGLSTVAAYGGILIGYLIYRKGLPKSEGWDLSAWNPFRRAAGNQFGYDKSMVDIGVDGGGALANFSWKVLDAKGVDGVVNGLGGISAGIGRAFGAVQSGFVRSYALLMMLGGAGLVGYLVYLLTVAQGGAR
ncbi:MAG: NADH-quinone oxidoreductase subunit L [Armatimonadetes bacterium]|nr:NADH-quinone oxidoreductase subunit L [Armatimonadota bacterium]